MPRYTMKAVTMTWIDEKHTRCPEWDYFFDAADYDEACGKGYQCEQAFGNHDAEGVKYLEGPYETFDVDICKFMDFYGVRDEHGHFHKAQTTPNYWQVFELDNESDKESPVVHSLPHMHRCEMASGWWDQNLDHMESLATSHYYFWRFYLCNEIEYLNVCYENMMQPQLES